MRYRDLLSVLVLGTTITFMTVIVYTLALFITGYPTPFKTLEANVIGVATVFTAVTVSFAVLTIIINMRPSDRKTNAEIHRQFALDYTAISFKIRLEKDKKKKEELRKQRTELHQEYLSITSARLQRKDGTVTTDWRESLLATRRRLMDEKDTLTSNNSTNLEAAIFMAFLGIVLPVCYIFIHILIDNTGGENDGLSVFVADYWPIFSVLVVFEIIALFFLRLYSQTAQRLERNKNELTNIELRLTAGLMLCDEKNKTKLKPLADELAKEERNFILGKNESSALPDHERVAEILSKFVPRIGG